MTVQIKQPARRPVPRERGTAIFLVMVVLALLTIMGAAYLQMCRVHAMAAKTQAAADNSLTVAVAGVMEVADLLKRDLVNENGEFFTPGLNGTADDGPIPGIENYDYPFTNTTDTADDRNLTKILSLIDGSDLSTQTGANGVDAVGGHHDDRWLASTIPTFSGSNAYWDHISNINGLFLALPTIGNTSVTMPKEILVNFQSSTSFRSDTNIGIDTGTTGDGLDDTPGPDYQNTGVDVDGDGVLDSRWTWAPIPQIGGVSYVIAYRVIDLSSLLNLNVATSATSEGVTASGVPGLYPSSADLSRLFKLTGQGAWDTELAGTGAGGSIFSNRGLTVGVAGMGLSLGINNLTAYPTRSPAASYDADSLAWTWLERARVAGSAVEKFNLTDEFELRYRGGLNNSAFSSDLELVAPTVLRDAAATESTFESIDYSTLIGGSPTTAQKRVAFFQGADSSYSSSTAVGSRKYPAIRHMLTTTSGAAAFSPNFNNVHAGAHTLQYDLTTGDYNHTTGVYDVATRFTNLYSRLWKILSIGDTVGGVAGNYAYLGLNAAGADQATVQQIATEFALAIQDYSDADSVPTGRSWDGSTYYYGLECLPFLREVYIQAGYSDQDEVDTPSTAPFPTRDDFDAWVMNDGEYVLAYNGSTIPDDSRAMAIEIGNPFDRTIPAAVLANVKIVVVQNVGGTLEDVSECILMIATSFDDEGNTVNNLDAVGDLASRDHVVVVSNPKNPVTDASVVRADLRADLTSLGSGTNWLTRDRGKLVFKPNFDIQVELRVLVANPDTIIGNSDDIWVAYDRLYLPGFQFPSKVDHPDTPTAAAEGVHAQASLVRDGQGIRYISNAGKALADTILTVNDAYDVDYSKLHADAKGVAGDATLDGNTTGFQIPIANRKILSTAELGWIFMFGFTNEPDGDFPTRFSGPDGTTGLPPERRFLQINPATLPASTGITHAAMLMQEFTTLSPRNDGMDNDDADGNGIPDDFDVDDASEQLVPGTININTAPLHILTLAAPVKEAPAETEALMKEIINYRKNAGTVPSRWRETHNLSAVRQAPGIASFGELLNLNPSTFTGDVFSDMQVYGFDGLDNINDPPAAWQFDTYPMAGEGGAGYIAKDGPEEKMARFYHLRQVFNTRSDLYAVYIVVQGYPANNFTTGPVASKRIVAILDRSGITDANGNVKLVGLYEIN